MPPITSWMRLESRSRDAEMLTSLGERVLTAQEYFAGHLDWHAFDVNANMTLGAATDEAFTDITQTVIPAPVSFRGMPAMRFWEFEDAQVDFGSVEAGATDLVRMLRLNLR